MQLNINELFGQNIDQLKETQEQVRRKAYAEVASRITQIDVLLDEIKQIKDATGISVDLESLGDSMSDIDNSFYETWNSSHC